MPLLVTLMRYVYYFRIYLSSDNYELIIKFASYIETASNSVRTMVFLVINSFLSIRHGDFQNFRNLKPHYISQNCH